MDERWMGVFRSPIITYQRYRDHIEDAVVAAALALVVGIFLNALGAFPEQWRMVLLLGIFALGVQVRAWGYYAAVAVLLWPIWQLSPYLGALFLAITLLPRTWIVETLPWMLLVASAPLLAEWQIIGLVPLLAGVMAGPGRAMGIGVLAALWLKIVGGLSGWLPEIGALHGAPFAVELVQATVARANSLETLLLLLRPFSQPSPSLLLLHVLQVVAWGAAGWLTGHIYQMEWKEREPEYLLVPTLATGALVLWGAIYLVPAWLDLQPLTAFMSAATPAVGLALSAMAAGLCAMLYEGLQRPVPKRSPRPQTTTRMGREGPETVTEESTPRRRPWADGSQTEEDDVIMLELD